MNSFQYDLCIVGAGMVGSAAARYASMDSNLKVCLIGPNEPKNRTCSGGDEIFGTHYDNGRSVCRTEHVDPFWGNLARTSIREYRYLEQMSGIDFFHNVGYMSIGCFEYLNKQKNKDFIKITSNDLRERLGYMQFSGADNALLDEQGGWINPRKLVDAEILMASKQGCDVIRDVVSDIKETENGLNGYIVVTDHGKTFTARRVLLATNVFTLHRKLLPGNILPKFNASPQTVVMGEVDESDVEMLRTFPSIVYHGPGGGSWYKNYPRNRDGNIHLYGSSMVKYPDGKFYVKIGHSDDILHRYLTLDEVSGWYSSSGDPKIVQQLTELLKSIFTGLKFRSFKSDACVTMVTATGRPYVDMIGEKFGVAIGGNGHAAMSCDAIGRLAAHMMLGVADEDEMKVLTRCKMVFENKAISKL